MPEALYHYLEIDTGTIWAYERSYYYETKQFLLYDQLCLLIEPVIVQQGIRPFIKADDESDYALRHRTEYANAKSAGKLRELDYFVDGMDFYQYEHTCVVDLEEGNSKTYNHLLAYKLRQYGDNLPLLIPFLYYQMKKNFMYTNVVFYEHITMVCEQYKHLVDGNILEAIRRWNTNFDAEKLLSSSEDWLGTVDNDYVHIKTNVTDFQVREYFSFLYLENTDNGKPLMEKQAFNRLFEFGFCYPTFPLWKRQKLNLTSKYRKSILEAAVYYLFKNHSDNLKDKTPFLLFLANNFEEFKMYQSETDLRNWSRNLSGAKIEGKFIFDHPKYAGKLEVKRNTGF